MASDADQVEEEAACAALPPDCMRAVYERLSIQDMLRASHVCRHWQSCADDLAWEAKALARWRFWPPERASEPWRVRYRTRHALDCRVLQLLEDAAWPERQPAVFEELQRMGAPAVLDVLAAAAHASCASPLLLGVTLQAAFALSYVRGAEAAERAQRLLGAARQQGGGGQEEEGKEGAEAAAAAGLSPPAEDPILECALLVMQVVHPLSCADRVRGLVARMGQELRRRMAAAEAQPGSPKALELLNQLMFGAPAAAATPAAAAATAETMATGGAEPEVASGGESSGAGEPRCARPAAGAAGAGAAGGGGGGSWWPGWWRRNEDLDGPDLSGFTVPSDGRSGIGLRGAQADYYAPCNSAMDSVLARRQGLPISLAVLHRAVGRAAGIRVDLCNMPGHVITRVALGGQQPAAAAAGGPGGGGTGSDRFAYVDVFAGGALLDDGGIHSILGRVRPWLAGAVPPPALSPMRPAALVRRMLLNLLNALSDPLSLHHAMLSSAAGGGHSAAAQQLQTAAVACMLLGLMPGRVVAAPDAATAAAVRRLVDPGGPDGLPGSELLLRRLAECLRGQEGLDSMAADLLERAEMVAQRAAVTPSRVNLRAEHPTIAYRVGDVLALPGSSRAVVVGWLAARPSLAGGDGQAPPSSTADRVLYKLLVDGSLVFRHAESLPGPASGDGGGGDGDGEAAERERAAWDARYAGEREAAAECLRLHWHEGAGLLDALAARRRRLGLAADEPGGGGESGGERGGGLGGWPDAHLELGAFFEAWVPGGAGGGGGRFAPNSHMRALYPQG